MLTTRSPSRLPSLLSPTPMVATGWVETLASKVIAVMQHATAAAVDGAAVVAVAAGVVVAAAVAAVAAAAGKTEEPSRATLRCMVDGQGGGWFCGGCNMPPGIACVCVWALRAHHAHFSTCWVGFWGL